MAERFDVAVIGGGIVGLAHAWRAAARGLSVVLLERDDVASGGTVRNFGMIWPIGQPAGEMYDTAIRSSELWKELAEEGAVEVWPCGSLHLAHRDDEMAVLEEFVDCGSHAGQLLTAGEVTSRSELANPDGLRGGLFSETELRVDPRTAAARISDYLAATKNVKCLFRTPVSYAANGLIKAADGRSWNAERIIICSGSDLQTLYPAILQESGLRLCKLQMLATREPESNRVEPHIASGLTLRHYTSFQSCPSLDALKKRIAAETPELDRYGIHVMASRFPNGQVILGDSHEYDHEITPFNKSQIDDLMLGELRKLITLSDWTIRERWHGVYAKHSNLPVFEKSLEGGVHVFVGTGGAGMTMSFGLAEQAWSRWTGSSN